MILGLGSGSVFASGPQAAASPISDSQHPTGLSSGLSTGLLGLGLGDPLLGEGLYPFWYGNLLFSARFRLAARLGLVLSYTPGFQLPITLPGSVVIPRGSVYSRLGLNLSGFFPLSVQDDFPIRALVLQGGFGAQYGRYLYTQVFSFYPDFEVSLLTWSLPFGDFPIGILAGPHMLWALRRDPGMSLSIGMQTNFVVRFDR